MKKKEFERQVSYDYAVKKRIAPKNEIYHLYTSILRSALIKTESKYFKEIDIQFRRMESR